MTDIKLYILTFRCVDGPGIVHAITGALLEVEGNILEQAQFTDEDSRIFSMRTKFESPLEIDQVRLALMARVAGFDPRGLLAPRDRPSSGIDHGLQARSLLGRSAVPP